MMLTPRQLHHFTYEVFTGKSLQHKRIQFIQNYIFRQEIIDRFQIDHNIKNEDIPEIVETFKSYLMIFTGPEQKFYAMPSLIVDELWHTFILFTKDYFIFCKKAFSHYLHHSPNSVESDHNISVGGNNTYSALKMLNIKFDCLINLKQYSEKEDFFAHIFEIDNKISSV